LRFRAFPLSKFTQHCVTCSGRARGAATIDEGNPVGSSLFGRPVIVSSDVAANTAYLGDLSRALTLYLRQGIVAESSRDAEFSLDNVLFRFGMRWDVAIVEPNQINRYVIS
jgi:HK97 family phage major capsid protein